MVAANIDAAAGHRAHELLEAGDVGMMEDLAIVVHVELAPRHAEERVERGIHAGHAVERVGDHHQRIGAAVEHVTRASLELLCFGAQCFELGNGHRGGGGIAGRHRHTRAAAHQRAERTPAAFDRQQLLVPSARMAKGLSSPVSVSLGAAALL